VQQRAASTHREPGSHLAALAAASTTPHAFAFIEAGVGALGGHGAPGAHLLRRAKRLATLSEEPLDTDTTAHRTVMPLRAVQQLVEHVGGLGGRRHRAAT
jgi:hypothetical protein